MLRLPAALLEDISLRAGHTALSQTCKQLWRLFNQPETQLRFYLAAQQQRDSSDPCCSSPCSAVSTSSTDVSCSDSFGPATVYGLLCCRARPSSGQGALRLLHLMLACGGMIHLFPAAQQEAVQNMLASTDSRDVPRAVELLMTVLPYAQHCLLDFCAAKGHLQLVKAILPMTKAPVKLHGVLHYVKTSAFLAAAAGGHVPVLSELLAVGAAHWACQLPGASLTTSALDLAALGGHMEAMQLLSRYVANPSPYFLTAAADSGSGAAMEWALQQWFGQFSAVTAFSRAHVLQMHDAVKVSCQRGHVSAVRQLLAALHRTNNDDCCVLALTYASSTSNTDAIRAVLDSPQLPLQLSRGGPKLLSKLCQAVASCVRIAILKDCRPALDLLLHSLASSSSPIAAARPLLASHMRFIFDTAAQSGNGTALQLLLFTLPEHYEALGVSALEAALSEGHADVAATIKTLLIMQGADQAAAAAALSPEGSPELAKASLHGAYKGACVRGDTSALQSLLQQGPAGPDDNMQLLLLRLAAGAGREEAVRLLLREFGGGGPRLEANLRAICRGAVHAGQLQLLQSLASDRPHSALLAHITSQPEALAEYLRAALLCGQVDVAAWLVLLAHKQREMEMVRVTLSSLLTTSRWELLNAGRGIASHEVVFELLKRLAAQSLSSGSRSQRSSDSSSMSVVLDTEGAATDEGEPTGPTGQQDAASSPTAAAAGTSQGVFVGVALGGGAPAEPATALASSTAAAGGDDTGAAEAGQQQQPSSLGQEVLQPQLLGQLLHVSQGYPWRLLTVVQLVDWWGLDPSLQVQQQLLQTPPATNLAQQERGAQLEQQGAPTAPAQGRKLQQQQPETTSDSAMSAPNPLATLRSSSSASESSDEAAHDDSSVTSSSSNASGSGTGDAACDVVSPCVAQPRGGGGAASNAAASGLLPTNSLEVGSLHSDDCQQTSTWLDDLIHKGPAATNAASTAAAGGQQQQQTMQQGLHQQQGHAQSHTPQHIPSQEMPALAKEWGGSWQQLTGQVAQLHMNSSPCKAQQAAGPTRGGPRQSFDYEQHIARQLRQQGSGRCARRESSPGRRPTAVAAQRQLRASLSHQPLVLQASRCPVHPYMQQPTSGQQ